ncbi:MAG TPA: GntR family transcriptional regulator [Nitriliruptorales bacterium]
MADDSIRRSDPLPFYVQLATILRDRIGDGDWEPGGLLPSEAELGDRYGISRTAVRQALDQLVDEGLVHKEKGRGTFVSRPTSEPFRVQELRGFFEEMHRRGETVTTTVLRQELTVLPPEITPELDATMGAKAVVLERIRHVDGVPFVKVRTHLPADRFADLVDTELAEGTLYGLLHERHDVQPSGGRYRFHAEVADDALAGELGLCAGAPILRVTAVNVDQHGDPFEHFVAWYRGDEASFDVTIDRAARGDVPGTGPGQDAP